MKPNHFYPLLVILFMIPTMGVGQLAKEDSLALVEVVRGFQESIVQKDSIGFNKLFFDQSVGFVGIMSKETEWSIKKNYADFQGIAISNHKGFIADICKSDKKQQEEFYNIRLWNDGAIATISFDYAFLANDKMIQWGHEKWNLVKDAEQWLITDVIYTIRFPKVEPFPFE